MMMKCQSLCGEQAVKAPAISAIILTYNEENNLEECLNSITGWVNEIIIVDSYSTDNTLRIAERYTNQIFQRKFINQAEQFNWALSTLSIKNEWVVRVDADERWTKEGWAKLLELMKDPDVCGISVRMKIYFMGKWIRFGDFYPNYFMRVFKKSKTSIENRWMDEHLIVEGKTIISDIDVIESNYDRQQNLALWTIKHNNYSTREAVDFLITRNAISDVSTIAKFWGNKTERKRWIKEKVYSKVPLFVRPFLYFTYRYFFKLGFLDGKEGLIFHLLQGFWYRFLVDAKIYQIEKRTKSSGKNVNEVLTEIYNINV